MYCLMLRYMFNQRCQVMKDKSFVILLKQKCWLCKLHRSNYFQLTFNFYPLLFKNAKHISFLIHSDLSSFRKGKKLKLSRYMEHPGQSECHCGWMRSINIKIFRHPIGSYITPVNDSNLVTLQQNRADVHLDEMTVAEMYMQLKQVALCILIFFKH